MTHTGLVHSPANPGPGHRVVGPEPGPARHAARTPARPARMAAAVAGGGALMLAVALGVPGLLRSPADGSAAAPTVATAKRITVSRTPPVVPLSDTELREVVDRSPDYGALSDPARRASCLTGLGYPAGTPVLGARTVRVDDRPAVVLVLAGDSPGLLTALVVDPGCSAADTGLVADTTIARR